ncbi:MAG TPA: membrane dipeptidase [Actinomycetota bacterium]|nr:membrane dipeptidase [Actinomycetota bacterium]
MSDRRDPRERWDGYTSFSYLVAGEDYRAFDLSPQIGRVPPYVVPLGPEEEDRAARLLVDHVFISLHDHGGIGPVDWADNDAYVREGREWYGYEGIAASGLDAVFENFLDGTATITSKAGWKWTDVIHDLGMHLADVAHQRTVVVGSTVGDIVDAHATGRIALIPCVEGAAVIENELDRLDVLFGLGVRMCGVTYSESNALGGGVKDPVDAGLTRFGEQAVTRMNRLGMAIDVSHTGDVTAMQTCARSTAPVFLSHSGARALFSERKLKEDDLLRAVADTGGVIGIEASPHTTISPAHPRHSIDSVMDHLAYCIDLVGVDHVAFGPDTFFGDHVALHRFYAGALDTGEVTAHEWVEHVEGVENASEYPNLVRWLVGHGYDDASIGKIMGGNVLRALTAVWPA